MGFRNVAGPFQNLIDVVAPALITATVPQNYFSVIGRVFGLSGNLVRYAIPCRVLHSRWGAQLTNRNRRAAHRIAFILRGTGDCNDPDTRIPALGIALIPNTQRAGSRETPLVFTNPGAYGICLSMDAGVTWTHQLGPQANLQVTGMYMSLPNPGRAVRCVVTCRMMTLDVRSLQSKR
jgi:hypothetical protein